MDPLGDTVDATLAREHADVAKGTVLAGRYEILDVLGAGGMGTVTRAHDRELDEIVALKILHGSVADLDAFRREVKLARRVTHRNVARTFELGEHQGTRFITMELVRGESVAKLLERRGRLAPEEAVGILCGVCDGLAAAHAVAIVHRDIKPENVLVEDTGRVVITDFGIAREQDLDAKRSQHVAGTPLYIAPEQLEGKAIDARTDLYSLGAMAYEILVGEPAWSGPALVAMSRRLVEPPPDPRAKRPELDPRLAQATLRCMARDPADRFGDAIQARDAFASAARSASRVPSIAAASVSMPSRTLAVLPFKHDAENWVVEGIADDLVDGLSAIKGVRVLSRAALSGQSGESIEIGKRLGIGHVVEGQVRRAGETLRMSVRLIEVATGFVVWAGRFELKESVLSAQDDIARAVATALGLDHGAARKAPSDAESIALYLKARALYHTFELGATRDAVALLEKAVERSPDNAVLQAGLSLAYQRRSAAGFAEPAPWTHAIEAADRAIRLAPDLGEAHLALAQLQLNRGDPIDAARSARIAVRNAPSLGDAHELLGRVLFEAGRIEDAKKRFDAAERLDPDLVHVPWERARMAAFDDDWERFDALRAKWEAKQARGAVGRLVYEVRYAAWRNDRKGLEHVKEKLRTSPEDIGPLISAMLDAMIGAIEGRYAPKDIWEFLKASETGGDAARVLQWKAQLSAELAGYRGDAETCADAIAKAADSGLFDRVWLERCKLLAPARSDPRYAIALEKVRAKADAIVDAIWD